MKATIAFMFFLLFLAGLALVNLRNMQDTREENIPTPATLSSVDWRPVRLGELTIPDDSGIFVRFDGAGQVSGSDGCNRFTGSFEQNGGSIVVGLLATTRMSCVDYDATLANSVLQSLQDATQIRISSSVLEIRGDKGQQILILTAVEPGASDVSIDP